MANVLTYVLDESDCVEWVSPSWDSAAASVGAVSIASVHALGRPLWAFIGDPTTDALYRALLPRVRAGHGVMVPFSGDDSTMRRDMQLRLQPLPRGRIRCTSVVTVEQPLATSAGERVGLSQLYPLVLCAWCGLIRVQAAWRPPEVVLRDLRVFMHLPLPLLSHGVCPSCERTMLSTARFDG